jgi:hypothetical protein
VEHGVAIITVAAQLGVLVIFIAIRQRFYCLAEWVLCCAGVWAIAAGRTLRERGHPADVVGMLGWCAFLVGLLIQFLMPRQSK